MTEQAILGRDFLSKYDTIIYNKSNKLFIRDVANEEVEPAKTQINGKELKSVTIGEESGRVEVLNMSGKLVETITDTLVEANSNVEDCSLLEANELREICDELEDSIEHKLN